ncbi:MAG: xanthine dehydrogenase small subunit [Bryobacteraceae bacterium]
MDFLLNGRTVQTDGFSAHTTLLEYLRASGLTGAKEGCAEGECGACAVALVAPDGARSRYRAVNSCLVFLPSIAGQEVYTVEGLACAGQLSEPQRAIAEGGGSQCGYCTPGFAVSLFAEYYRPGRTGPCDPLAMGGNLCRCTGYRPLRDAALSLHEPQAMGDATQAMGDAPRAMGDAPRAMGDAPRVMGDAPRAVGDAARFDAFLERLRHPAPPLAALSAGAAGARFERPASLADCLALLAARPEACLVAGATDLGVEANLRGRCWPLLVSVEAVPELKTFSETADAVEIGAGLTLSEVEERWTSAPEAVRDWFALFASPLIRNRATLGGNLATASPVGDSAPLLLALDTELRIAGPQRARCIPLRDFFTGYRQTALRPGELIASLRIPRPLPSRFVFYKVAKRVMDDISTVAAAFALDLDAAGRITRARAAYGGVAATPVLIAEFRQALLGRPWNRSAVHGAQVAVATAIEPIGDHRGSAAYRLAVAQSLIEKFWWKTREAQAA